MKFLLNYVLYVFIDFILLVIISIENQFSCIRNDFSDGFPYSERKSIYKMVFKKFFSVKIFFA